MDNVVLKESGYASRTPKTRAMFERAKKVEPAGVSYGIRWFEPYPFFAKEARGAKLVDIDGNTYTDYWCTHFAMILGHAYPAVMEAIKAQAERGWHFGVSHELEVTLSETITKHVPSAELVRYTSSGSEANLFAIRLARTFTKRFKIAKFEGGWHGAYDPLHLATKPPYGQPPSGGITQGSQRDTVVVPYNDFEGFKNRVRDEQLACVLLEPVLSAGGGISAEIDFLKALREYCDRTRTLLIYDEIVTGFRLGLSGAQGLLGVMPDLTVLGKIIGGGLPIGAVCGRRDVMEHMDHLKYSGLDYAYHGGTFAGNALTMAAGLAAIDVLEHQPAYDHIDKLGKMCRVGLNVIFEKNAFPAQAVGVGSLVSIHMINKKPLRDVCGYAMSDHQQSKNLFNYLLASGIFVLVPTMLHGAVSYAHSVEDIQKLLSTVEQYVQTQH